MSKRQSSSTPFPTQSLQHGHVQDARGGLAYVLNRAKELLALESIIHNTIATEAEKQSAYSLNKNSAYSLNKNSAYSLNKNSAHSLNKNNAYSSNNLTSGLSTTNIKVASLEGGILHIVTTSGAIATRIKYSQANLIALLKRQKKPFFISAIKVTVQPKESKPKPSNKPAIPPSQTNAKLLEDTAQYIEDQPLREALIKLSTRSSENKESD